MKREEVVLTKKESESRLFSPKKTGRLVPCLGEAHTNPFIDHCLLCAPNWGQIAETEPVTVQVVCEALRHGLIVSYSAARGSAVREELRRLIEVGSAEEVEVLIKHGRGSMTSFLGVRSAKTLLRVLGGER